MKQYMDLTFEIKGDDIQDNGTFKGYGSTFGGKPDTYGDIVVEGAFSETLKKGGVNGFGVAMLYQHQHDKPIGVWTSLAENKKGLAVEGQLAMGTQLGQETYELMKLGALKGLSIGYDIPKGGLEVDPKKGVRYLKQINLWEISPVTFPANRRSQITGVKAIAEATNERELESALRDAGLSFKAAKYVVSLCKPSLRDLKGDQKVGDIVEAIDNINLELQVQRILNN